MFQIRPVPTAYRGRLLLALLPAALFALLFTLTPAAKPRPKSSSMPYAERLVADTFTSRFGDETPVVRRVRTLTVVRDLPPPTPLSTPAEAEPSVQSPVPTVRRRVIRKASLDLCQRHGMRKVHYGKRWRCRR